MPNLIKYHVYVTFPGSGEIEVFPKNDTIKYGWQKTNDVWRKKVDTKLWFVNEPPGPKTFDIFASLELEECGCHRLDMRITVKCPGTNEEGDLFFGVLMFIDGEWFFDVCSVEIKPRVNDPFECLFKNWETDVNILVGSGSPVTLTTDTGSYEEVLCQGAYPGGAAQNYLDDYEEACLAGEIGADWQVRIHTVIQGSGTVFVETKWIREIFNGAGPPPGGGWTQVNPTFWTRPVILQGPTIEESTTGGAYVYIATWEVQSQTLDNGRLLSAVLINLFSVCDTYALRSDFLGIDPDDTAPVNDAYTYAQEWIHDAVVFQMHDVVRIGASENSTIAMVNLSDLWGCLKIFPELFLYFDDVNQVYRIEHISYQRQSNLINLVTQRPDAIRGYNSYAYDKNKIPQKEIYKWSYETNDVDWDGASIVYEDCNDVGNIKTHEIDCFHTDFGSLVGSGITDLDVLKGLVIVAQKDGQIHRAAGAISGLIKPNAGLSWANVVKELWRWRRPSCTAIVNGELASFLSLAPKIRQKGFSAELCCSDVLQLNPAIDRVRTGLGNGEFDQDVTLDLSTGMTEFDLLFAPPITLVDLTISISVNDATQCYFTDFIFETNEDFPSGVIITWDFGVAAVPATAMGQGPHTVQYTTAGVKTVTVTATYAGETSMAQITVTVASCPANITGRVYDTFDFPFQAANVKTFLDVDMNGVSDGGTPVKNVNTNSSGQWTNTNMTPGYYVAVLTLPAGWEPIDDYNAGDSGTPGNEVNDLPNISPTDLAIPLTLSPSVTDGHAYFIISPLPGIIRGTVFDDIGNPFVNAEINIYADDDLDGVAEGASLYQAFTDAAGAYEILDVLVATGDHSGATANTAYGNYVIVLTVPGGFFVVSGIDTTPDSDLVTNTPTTDEIIPCTMRAGEVDANNNFIIETIP